MSRISLELVPRSEQALLDDLNCVKDHFPQLDTVNIPDIIRFPLRSWTACQTAAPYITNRIPHIRSIDFTMDNPQEILDVIHNNSLKEVLIVSGDPPQDLSRKVYRTSATKIISFLRKELPDLKVYAALDPYRSGLKAEIDYVQKKVDAGAQAVFTQPFFDVRYMDIYAEQLHGLDIYWGVSPVLGERSRSYWENRNHAFFPKDFESTLEWNIAFAKEALAYVRERGDNIYFMPIRTDLQKYLGGILN
ncbi:MAG: methylenetetrahydrofolate reductase [Lentisphaeraceae bacterium]|nr:methylenetetrahydrofolate reductase [Lentisphaeraceae bacterium]